MADSNFIDYVKICCRSGSGGPGSRHYNRTKINPRGGPDGGDGGKGGDIILQGNTQLWTLLHLKYRKHVLATDGIAGSENRSSGAYGDSIVLEVPLGTVAKDAETGEVFFEITEEGEKKVLVPGGRGGLGNCHFANSVNQSPQYAQPGETGIERWIVLELKVLADVGLVGFPNVGKSTLLSVISAAKPEIADYPFTTLVPNLGVVNYRDYRSFIVADIPGIIEGASKGKGLGHRFLRHIERNAALLFLLPADSADHRKEYQTLLSELEKFNPELLIKQRIVAVSKSDMLDDELQAEIRLQLDGIPIVFFSAVTEQGIAELLDVLWKTVSQDD
ncbi:MAG: GTPase ObgE [Flavobacteriales bacterium]|nr:MAG: GTPase ObgE [Flavobacteriales bacterium]